MALALLFSGAGHTNPADGENTVVITGAIVVHLERDGWTPLAGSQAPAVEEVEVRERRPAQQVPRSRRRVVVSQHFTTTTKLRPGTVNTVNN